uniref:TNF receptor superfamily member 17 n=1 Tax=Dromaius novaehollandiae TaxID=8790 RepID=A0A8C4KK38_DRONO
MAQCPKNEYFDSLLLSCKPCHLRCAGTPPPPCEKYCDKSTDSGGGVLWICFGVGVILMLTLFLLMVLFKWKHLKQLKEKLKNTDSSVEPNDILKVNTESSANTNGIRHSLQNETLMYSVEECTCSDCGLVEAQTGCETSFPLPATEEGATVLVTTKSFDYCNYILGAG